MGTVAHFPLGWMRTKHNLRSFVETGTAEGEAVVKALEYGFDPIHSIEIMPKVAEAARLRFDAFKTARIWEGDSRTCLPLILAELPPEPALFWLDAHFPGTFHGARYGDEPDAARRLPLHDELRTIRAARPSNRDVILIDDCRIYVPGQYDEGDAPEAVLKAVEGLVERGPKALDFVRELYGDTHEFIISAAHHGYGMVFPKVALEKAA